tara:strand:- start:372 stop:1433 length:1062 start_codon:yes stop_codon:yes gene_type:complete
MEAIEQTFNGSVALGSRVTATISRNGDLVSRMYLEFVSGFNNNACSNPGSAVIDNVECEIGGQRIDKQYGHWMEVWAELTEPNDSGATGLQAASLTAGTKFQNMSAMGGVLGADTAITDNVYVPLQFWFCRNPGLALPLIALQYHEVKIIVNFQTLELTTFSLGGDVRLFVDYIYLDTDERRRFAQVSHEYLIEQVQHQSFSGTPTSMELNLNHPVKELIWSGVGGGADTNAGPSTPTDVTGTAATYQLKLNGHDRFAARSALYFTRTQVWQHHTGYGGITASDAGGAADSIAVYSFALNPEEHQPSGTCNFSRIDNAKLVVGGTGVASYNVYAVNYNVLRIMSGMGGLAYSN